MKFYNYRCQSCNSELNDNNNCLGYVKNYQENKTKYCERCFKLIHYNELINPNNLEETIQETLSNFRITDKWKVFLVLDILNLEQTMIDNLRQFNDQLVFVINKCDILSRSVNWDLVYENIEETIKKLGFENPNIILTSINNKSSIKHLYSLIKKMCQNHQKIIFMGKSNVGKSSLINALLSINGLEPKHTISHFTNTTINLNSIKIKTQKIYDSPGFIDKFNIVNYLKPQDVKKIIINKPIKPINFFLNINQSILIDQIVIFSTIQGQQTNVTFYMSNQLHLNRCKIINADKNIVNEQINQNLIHYSDSNFEWKEYEFELDETKKHNISISGLGLISLNPGLKKIKIKVNNRVGVNLNSYAII